MEHVESYWKTSSVTLAHSVTLKRKWKWLKQLRSHLRLHLQRTRSTFVIRLESIQLRLIRHRKYKLYHIRASTQYSTNICSRTVNRRLPASWCMVNKDGWMDTYSINTRSSGIIPKKPETKIVISVRFAFGTPISLDTNFKLDSKGTFCSIYVDAARFLTQRKLRKSTT